MKRLTSATIVDMHQTLIEQSGGSAGVRDINLLESAVNSPFQTFAGKNLYPSLQAIAAHLGFALVKNHPFIDGNKRIGILAMMTFLELNDNPVAATDDELITLGLHLAADIIDETYLNRWIQMHT